MECCDCRNNSKLICIIEVIVSIIIGVIIGILFTIGLIPIPFNFIRIALVLGAISLAILVGSLFAANLLIKCNSFKKCVCKVNICLLIATIGTILAATAAATIGFGTIIIASIIAVALTGFFFVWMIMSIISLVSCLIKTTCKEEK